ncbi:MAG: membrane protein [Acidimicrobiales bacterium]|nr:MAG: membrane protein [Acidimicrobiales bacterium]
MSRSRSGALRGALVGLFCGLVAAGFFWAVGEPHIDKAIEIEEARSAGAGDQSPGATHAHGAEEAPEAADEAGDEPAAWTVSRSTQRSVGLFSALGLGGAALGALVGAVHATTGGHPFYRAVRICATGFFAVHLLPWFKYPPNPPAVGDPDTIAYRQTWYALLVVAGLLLVLAVGRLRRMLKADPGSVRPMQGWRADLAAGLAFAAGLVVLLVAFPPNPDPIEVPAKLIWDFRVVSLAGNALLWSALAVGIGGLAAVREERATSIERLEVVEEGAGAKRAAGKAGSGSAHPAGPTIF